MPLRHSTGTIREKGIPIERSFDALLGADPGYAVNDIVSASVELPSTRYESPQEARVFFDDMLARLDGVSAIESVGAIDILPLTGANDTFAYPEGDPPDAGSQGFNAQIRSVTPTYFWTLQIPLVSGRGFTTADIEGGARVVMIDASIAAQIFPDEDPLGRRIVVDIGPMNELLSGSVAGPGFRARLMGIFSPCALLLAATGLYGVLSYFVAERRQDIGVRLAIGADAGGVVMLVVGRGMKLVAIGLVIGGLAAAALSWTIQGLLFGVSPADPMSFAGVADILVAVALSASLLPALRATRVDPIEILRAE